MAKYALVVGINDYSIQNQHSIDIYGLEGGLGNLFFCVADADSIYFLLTNSFNFEQQNIILLKNAQATRRNILSALTYMFANAEAGDTILFYYAGHGGIFPATTSPNNVRFYESIIPYRGDEIYDFRLYQAAHQSGFNPNEINFTCFLDCCHSGGMHPTDSSEMAEHRSAPFDPNVANFLHHIQEMWPIGICMADGSNELFPNVSGPVVENGILVDLNEDPDKNFVESAQAILIAACKYYETAGAGSAHGHLTQALIDVVNSSNFQISYDDLIDELINRVRGFTNGQQNPTLRGQQGRMNEIFLEGWNTSI